MSSLILLNELAEFKNHAKSQLADLKCTLATVSIQVIFIDAWTRTPAVHAMGFSAVSTRWLPY
jgi:hypothetical protein